MSSSHITARWCLTAISLLLVLAACSDSGSPASNEATEGLSATPTAEPTLRDVADPYSNETLDVYEIAVDGDPQAFLELAERPDEPFVMVNLLVFKEWAEGEGFEGMTGQEAYAMYGALISDDQAAAGSRLIWGAGVAAQLVGNSDPVFEVLALNEYASPSAFFEYVQREGSEEADAAREAGLAGQWAIAAATLAEGDPGAVVPTASPPDGADLEVSGLSAAQQQHLIDLGDMAPIGLIELVRFSDETGAAQEPWRDAFDTAVAEVGGALVWQGRLDTQVLGEAEPGFDELRLTLFPGAGALASALGDPLVVQADDARIDGLEQHWLYLNIGTEMPWSGIQARLP